MSKSKRKKKEKTLEQALWEAADKLRKNMDAAEYKHIVLGLIFLKYISGAFDALYQKLASREGKALGAEPEDVDEYRAENVFYVPPKARWSYLRAHSLQPDTGQLVDAAMEAVEKMNPTLQGVLPREYSRRHLDPTCLGQLISLIDGMATPEAHGGAGDLLGRVYEYCLGQFAAAEGKKGGQFYTPTCVVKLLVEMLQPFNGRVYDPCCGSGGMFVQSERLVLEHQGLVDDISIYGQESNATTYRLCRMNLAIRGIDASNIKWNNEGSLLNDAHRDLRAHYIMANPPFNDSDWSGELLRDDKRWEYGTPPPGNANFAWLQHVVFHLALTGTAGVVLSNGSLSSQNTRESRIRAHMVNNYLVDCVVGLPGKLFYNTGIPACLWFLTRSKQKPHKPDPKHRFTLYDRRNEILFIDASAMGYMINRKNLLLTGEEIERIAGIYERWRSMDPDYEDVPGLCKSASIDDVAEQEYILTPGRYVGFSDSLDYAPKDFKEDMNTLALEFTTLLRRGEEMDREIFRQLKRFGVGL